MAAATPTVPYTRDFKDTSITVWWLADKVPAGVASVALEIREFPKPEWRRVAIPAGTAEHVATGLFPNATFEFRLVYGFADGVETVGPACAADTLAAGCVPKDEKKKKGNCTVQ